MSYYPENWREFRDRGLSEDLCKHHDNPSELFDLGAEYMVAALRDKGLNVAPGVVPFRVPEPGTLVFIPRE